MINWLKMKLGLGYRVKPREHVVRVIMRRERPQERVVLSMTRWYERSLRRQANLAFSWPPHIYIQRRPEWDVTEVFLYWEQAPLPKGSGLVPVVAA